MNNKEKLVNIIDKEFSKKQNLDIIHNNINKSYRLRKRMKYAFASSFIIIFTFIFFINNNDKHLEENRNNINTNTSNNTFNSGEIYKENDEFDLLPESDSDSDEEICKSVKYVEIKGINDYDFYKDLNISDEYNSFVIYEVYAKEDTEFNKLNNYVILYKVKKDDKEYKEIEISFSKENIPISTYEFDISDTNLIKINDIDIERYTSNNKYMVIFKYDNINFNIKTFNVKEKELMELLKSIIK